MFKAFKKSLQAFIDSSKTKSEVQIYAEKHLGKKCLVWYGVFQIQGLIIGYNTENDWIIIESQNPVWIAVHDTDVILRKIHNGAGYRYAELDHIELAKEVTK
jgi:hypothetical protein